VHIFDVKRGIHAELNLAPAWNVGLMRDMAKSSSEPFFAVEAKVEVVFNHGLRCHWIGHGFMRPSGRRFVSLRLFWFVFAATEVEARVYFFGSPFGFSQGL